MFEVERRQQERCDCCSCPAAAALPAGHSSSRLCIPPPAAPEPCHRGHLGRAKPVPCGHRATCWLSCLLTLLGRGNKEQLCHQALEDWSSVQAGAVLGAAQGRARCAQRCFPDQGSHTLLWPLPALLSLQPIEGFVSLESRFLILQIIFSSPHSQLSALNEFLAVKRKKTLIALYKGKVRPGINTKERGQTFWL